MTGIFKRNKGDWCRREDKSNSGNTGDAFKENNEENTEENKQEDDVNKYRNTGKNEKIYSKK